MRKRRYVRKFTEDEKKAVESGLRSQDSFVLRRSQPNAPRPFRAFGYPWLPALYLLANLLVVGALLFEVVTKPGTARSPLLGLAILAVTYLVHRLLGRPKRSEPQEVAGSSSPTSAYVRPPAEA